MTDYLSSDQAMADLRALNARFIHNFITNDVAGHDAILHKDFLAIQPSGQRLERGPYLKRWANGFSPDVIPYWDVRDERITLIGPVALVRATNKYVVVQNGQEVTGMATYTDSYIYENGAWKCIEAHITEVKPEFYPGDETIISVYIRGVKQARAA